MELERYIKRLSQSLETCYIKDITTIVNEMCKDYDIRYKNTDDPVKPQVIIQKFRSAIRSESVVNICKGVSQNGNRCYRKINGDSGDYCKTHEYLAFKNKTTLPTSKVYIIDNHNVRNNHINQHPVSFSTDNDVNHNGSTTTNTNMLRINSGNHCIRDYENLDAKNFKQQLIQDTFYYVDSEYIYDKQTMQRVGYVDTELSDQQPNYVLTDDPFVLGLF